MSNQQSHVIYFVGGPWAGRTKAYPKNIINSGKVLIRTAKRVEEPKETDELTGMPLGACIRYADFEYTLHPVYDYTTTDPGGKERSGGRWFAFPSNPNLPISLSVMEFWAELWDGYQAGTCVENQPTIGERINERLARIEQRLAKIEFNHDQNQWKTS